VTKLKRIRIAGHKSHTRKMRFVYKVLAESLKGRDFLRQLSTDGTTGRILEKPDVTAWT
jgi:hypothetical protein